MVALAPDADRLSSDDLYNALLMRGGSMWARFILGGDGPLYEPRIANVSMLGVKATLRAADVADYESLRKLERRADDWWAAVTSWIEVLSGQDIKQIGPARQLWHNGTHLQFFPLNEQERLESAISAATPDVSGVVSSDQLRASFLHAGNGQLPPDEWLFLRDARSLHRAGEYRRALIDVGSAAEVALARIVENELADRSESPAFIAGKLSAMESLTLGQKIGYVEGHLKLRKLPPSFESVVLNKRNDAVHLRPTRKIDAERAIGKTTKLVERATPLASLLCASGPAGRDG
ncbi:hypothetical protein BCL50_3991 [Mycolicibacterium litorale]|nr:hypothetical protein BCL50_3991 [Mycolicibacterium litorale]